MVFFTCSHCGESIKKPSVGKHYQTTCKNLTPFVTCVDCLKDFKGNEYEAHTKCFTEEERYSAKGFVPKASANKGEKKQKAWSDCVQGLLSSSTLQEDEKNLLGTICKYDNIPRKRVKFINFLKSTARSFADKTDLIDRVWNKMENYFKEVNPAQKDSEEIGKSEKLKRKADNIAENNENVAGKKSKKKKHSMAETEKVNNVENGDDAGGNEKKKKKRKKEDVKEEMNGENELKNKKAKKLKMKGEENENEKKKNGKQEKSTENDDAGESGKEEDNTFNWTDTILKILSEGGSKNQIKLGKLQKKVLKKYGEVSGCEVDEKIIKKFSKQLNKMDTVVVNGDYVSLKS